MVHGQNLMKRKGEEIKNQFAQGRNEIDAGDLKVTETGV